MRRPEGTKVICGETGDAFDRAKDAAAWASARPGRYVHPQRVSVACHQLTSIAGELHFYFGVPGGTAPEFRGRRTLGPVVEVRRLFRTWPNAHAAARDLAGRGADTTRVQRLVMRIGRSIRSGRPDPSGKLWQHAPRCTGCGVTLAVAADGSWRFNGKGWEHRCPGLHPQVGHLPAEVA